MTTSGMAERILSVLELFTEERPEWTPDEMMAATGFARPTLYRYLRALKGAGLITSLAGAGYTLGPRIVEMDFLLRKSDPLIRAGEPYLRSLAERWPSTSLLVRWYGEKLLCVASDCSAPDPVSSYPRGRPMALARGAISRAILAHLPRRQAAEMIEQHKSDLTAIGLGATSKDISDSFRRIRRAGVAVAYGEVTPGVVGVAAPVFDAGQTPIAALCMTLAAEVAAPGTLPEITETVRDLARALSATLSRTRITESA